jgi:two-component system cell cycle response regulator DivK
MRNQEESPMSGSVSSPVFVSGNFPIRPPDLKGEFTSGLVHQMDNQPAHILIVDDAEGSRTVYAHFLTEKGYRVSKAHTVEEALEMALGVGPDLVVLHLWLPKINGWELTRRLKSNERTRHIPVLVLAGQTLALPRECDGFLRKPFQLDELGEEIANQVRAVAPVSPLPACA